MLAFLSLVACHAERAEPAVVDAVAVTTDARAKHLFDRHCALCHGTDGSGLGPGSALLDPPARDFGTAMFSLATTQNGVPTEADLVHTLRRGMPGSAMPPFAWMPAADLEAVAAYVQKLTTEGLARRLADKSRATGGALTRLEARDFANARTTPGEPVAAVPDADPTPASLAEGRQLYMEHCAACHGKDGKGRKPVRAWAGDYSTRLARDFTRGILKGGASRAQLAARIVAGMPAAAMPPTRLPGEKLAALVTYVERLLEPGAQTRLTQRRERIVARRIETQVPSDGAAPDWKRAQQTRLVLAPLSWHQDAILEAHVAALHDGRDLAIRVTWKDSSRDESPIASDGVALQFSTAASPPLFGMGAPDHPVNIWHWKSFRLREPKGLLDLLDNPPHARRDPITGRRARSDVPVYRPAPRLRKKSGQADVVKAEGHGYQSRRPGAELTVTSQPGWKDGRWTVVLSRALNARFDGELDLSQGSEVQVGLAIWNGAVHRTTSCKSVTIWHALVIEK